MPELPEVETVSKALEPHLIGRKIVGIQAFTSTLREPLTIQSSRTLLNSRIMSVGRRAKYILVRLDVGFVIIVHLGMSGSCRIASVAAQRRKHDHVVFELDNGQSWIYNDPRRFGLVRAEMLERGHEMPASLSGLPPEPLEAEFNEDYLHPCIRARSKAIKLILLDCDIIAGVGNIYACEALFEAGIRPGIAGRRLSRRRCTRLVESIKSVLKRAIRAGGTTISDFRSVDGSEGKFSIQLGVYGRAGDVCGRCNQVEIKKVVMGGRSTFYCPLCQH